MRPKPNGLVACDSCGRPESLGHVVQQCPRTHGQRVKRHNKIVDYIITSIRPDRFKVLKVPSIPTEIGIRKPDLVIRSKDENTSYIIDVSICADNTTNINEPRQHKISYYNQPEISSWVMRAQNTDRVVYDAVIFNWRGAIAPLSHKLLTEKLHVPKKKIEIVSVKVLEGGFLCWLAFKKSTFRS
eukprot:gene4463-5056_t